MLKCPYCYEELKQLYQQCPHCLQFIIDEVIKSDFASIDKKHCLFCGKKILSEAKFCRFCRKWLDEIDNIVNNIDPDDLV